MYYLLILVVGIERLIELIVAKRNARWAFSQGGKEFGHNHYPVMVTLHTALLLGCVIEVWGLHRPFIGWLGWPMLAVAAASARKGGVRREAPVLLALDDGSLVAFLSPRIVAAMGGSHRHRPRQVPALWRRFFCKI